MTALAQIERAIDELPKEQFEELRRWFLEKDAAAEPPKENRFKSRELLPGFAELMNKPLGGPDSGAIISEDRNRDEEM